MTGSVALRSVTPQDVSAVREIYAHHVLHGTGTFELTAPDEAEMAARIDAVTATGLPFLVATQGVDVLGFAYAGPYRPRPAYRFTVEDSIYLRADATGRGIGAVLLREVLDRCEGLGVRQVIAVIGDTANVASIRTHEKCGFATIGTFRAVGWKFGRWLDTVLMQRELGAGAGTSPELTLNP
ncbi:MAG TPA: GNAT family N-acetyltransferase [Ilumatobacteraceae bacterium]|nr:GNAT family N-acetyltransferase [Ilumatobacteraceae bacterium]